MTLPKKLAFVVMYENYSGLELRTFL